MTMLVFDVGLLDVLVMRSVAGKIPIRVRVRPAALTVIVPPTSGVALPPGQGRAPA